GVVAWSTSSTHCAATTVEQPQLHSVALENLHQLDLGLVQLPVRTHVTTVLIAVRIAEHDLLDTAAAFEHATIFRYPEQCVHDGATAAQIGDGLEQRDDIQGKPRW